jgi:arylsulfatase
MKTKIQLNTFAFCGAIMAFLSTGEFANAQAKKPNILIIWGDDIGQFNISAYNMGMMGYQTPNIDRLAKEGAIFTDWYGQQSCTAGRSAFITGQSPIRTGLTKVGLSGAPEGSDEGRPDAGRVAQALRLCMRPVWQEPSGRSQRVSIHGPRV